MGESDQNKRVVIVGGGIAGGILAKTLQYVADVVLIDPKEYYEIPWASLRAKVEPPFAERTVINHNDYINNGRIIVASAVNATDKEVLTSDGQWITYDYLVIATGHSDAVPRTRTGRLEQFKAANLKIKSAESILIVGGGPTGVELAGEIAVDFPEKKVKIVHGGSRLMEFIGPKASRKTMDWFAAKKVEVYLNQTIDMESLSEANGTYKTSAGETIAADCHFVCTGRPLGSSWLKETVFKDYLDEKGRLIVDEHLRVRGKTNVFAIGDITDIPEPKQGFYAQKHASVVAKSLKLLMKGGKESKMGTYKAGGVMAMVSLGRKEGVAQFPFATVIGCVPGMIKSKDLFVGKTRKDLGLDPRGH